MKTLEALRKEASELKIKNYCKYNKIQLSALIEETRKGQEEPVLLPAIISTSIVDKIEEVKVEPKKAKKTDIPRSGTQAREIYDIFKAHIGHKKWTVYRVTKDFDFSLNNVRRIYKRYFEAINQEIFAEKNAQKV